MSETIASDVDVAEYPSLLAGEPLRGTPVTIRCPYDGRPVAVVHKAGPADLEAATQAAVRAFALTRSMPAYQRAEILRKISAGIEANKEDFARTIALEAAKPITQARVEVGRSTFLFRYAGEEAARSHGETVQLDAHPNGQGRHGIVRRFPVGPVAAITPFNFPLNLVAHKLAPAIAAGCPVVLKPASQTPLCSLKLAQLAYDAGWPKEALSVLLLDSKDAAPLVEDERFKLLTFTGSPAVGWAMKGRAGTKRVTLELGGNAGVIVHQDADLGFAAKRTLIGGFSYAGQTCISVQRIFVHAAVYEEFMDQFVPLVQQLKLGDPLDESSDLSALISPQEGQRIREWMDEARAAGAELLSGGEVVDGRVQPAVLVKAGPQLRVNCQEVFAPIVTVQTYEEFDEAIAAINHSEFGLQAGLFTNDVRLIFKAHEQLEVGGLIVNDVPTWRVDNMPYGGVKQSGFGREGLRYAIEEMTEPKLLAINLV
jgi:acyl-CoA reductase-like NAD-dependent aldehyde dehydrogenase